MRRIVAHSLVGPPGPDGDEERRAEALREANQAEVGGGRGWKDAGQLGTPDNRTAARRAAEVHFRGELE